MGDEQDVQDVRDEMPESVTRYVDVDADVDAVWEAVADPERRRLWLDDDDAAGRLVHVERIDEGRMLSWTWWHPGDEGTASQVDVQLTQLDGGGTRVVVHERMLFTAANAGAGMARAQARSGNAWGTRLFGLQLLVAAAGALAAGLVIPAR